jgi:hypothetical protein
VPSQRQRHLLPRRPEVRLGGDEPRGRVALRALGQPASTVRQEHRDWPAGRSGSHRADGSPVSGSRGPSSRPPVRLQSDWARVWVVTEPPVRRMAPSSAAVPRPRRQMPHRSSCPRVVSQVRPSRSDRCMGHGCRPLPGRGSRCIRLDASASSGLDRHSRRAGARTANIDLRGWRPTFTIGTAIKGACPPRSWERSRGQGECPSHLRVWLGIPGDWAPLAVGG